MRRPLLLAPVIAAAACASGPELHPDAPELAGLSFKGNRALASDELEEGLATQPSSWPHFGRPPRFDEATFQGDLDRVLVLYKSRGYFDVRILDVAIRPVRPGAVQVTVTLEEGQPSRLRRLTVTGQETTQTEVRQEVEKPLPLKVAAIFQQEAYLASKAELLARIHEFAFAEAEVTGQAVVDRAAHAVDVSFQVHPGRHYVYSEFRVRGNVRIPLERITEEIGYVMKPGDDFQSSDLDTAQKRIFSLGVFSNVRVDPGDPDPKTGTLPVLVTVAEAPLKTVRAGAGLGIDVEHQEGHVSAGFTDRNFLGGLRRLDFDNTFALEFLPSVFNSIESWVPAGSSTLKLSQPEFFAHTLDLVTTLQVSRVAELGFSYWALRGRLEAPWRLTQHLTITPAYSAELLFFDPTSQGFSGLDVSPARLLSLSCQAPCVLSYLEQSVVWDRRNDPFEPTAGFYAALSIQEAGGPLGGDFSNTRWLPEVRGYLPLGRRDTLSARVQLGAIFTYGGTGSPIDQRFFLGGINSVRGYGAQRLSPMARVNTCLPAAPNLPSLCKPPGSGLGILDVPVGGNGLFQANLEYRHRFGKFIDLAAFVDSGEVTEQPLAVDFSPDTLAITPGLGLRVLTPVGPLRIDLAYQATLAARPITQLVGFPQPSYAAPSLPASAWDTCAWPFIPQTGWVGFSQPSACKSEVWRRLALSFAIGESF